jgi:hypothetical protein
VHIVCVWRWFSKPRALESKVNSEYVVWWFSVRTLYAATKIAFLYSFSGNYAVSVPISTFIERFIYSQDRSTYLAAAKYTDNPKTYKSLTDMWV